MKCREIRDILAEYVRGTLGKEQSAEVKKHLGHCASCAAEADSLKSYFKALASVPRVKAPADLLFKVRARIRAGEEAASAARSAWAKWRIPAGAAGALAAAALVAIFLFPQFAGKQRIALDESGFAEVRQGPAKDAPKAPAKASPAPANAGRQKAVLLPSGALAKNAGTTEQSKKAASEPDEFLLISFLPEEQASPLQSSGYVKSEEADRAADDRELQSLAVKRKTLKEAVVERSAGATSPAPLPQAQGPAETKADRIPQDSKTGIRTLIASLDGRMVKEEPDTFYLEIPARNYPDFLLKLATYGKFTPPPRLSGKSADVRIRLKFASNP